MRGQKRELNLFYAIALAILVALLVLLGIFLSRSLNRAKDCSRFPVESGYYQESGPGAMIQDRKIAYRCDRDTFDVDNVTIRIEYGHENADSQGDHTFQIYASSGGNPAAGDALLLREIPDFFNRENRFVYEGKTGADCGSRIVYSSGFFWTVPRTFLTQSRGTIYLRLGSVEGNLAGDGAMIYYEFLDEHTVRLSSER